MAMSEAGREAVWLRRLLGELGERQPGATTLHCDNQSAIHLGKNPATHQRTKHIDIRHHILRDMVEGKSIKLEYIR
ncbi:UNVERIFIED_CONTAM: Ty1/Copia family ribonuclease HI, partial [Bacteroidetes bacterium 56_B9]